LAKRRTPKAKRSATPVKASAAKNRSRLIEHFELIENNVESIIIIISHHRFVVRRIHRRR